MAIAVAFCVVLLGAPTSGAQNTPTTVSPAAPTTTQPPRASKDPGVGDSPGRVAYVDPTGNVVVADTKGANPVVVGHGAALNSAGLAPLAWSPVGSRVAYVRTDRSLVLADVLGGPEMIIATDAVVPAAPSETLLSFDPTGISVAYLAEGAGGVPMGRLAVFDGPDKGTVKNLSDPNTRRALALQFSPLDPYLYIETGDIETGQNLAIGLTDPFNGSVFPTPLSADDPIFAPDGAFVYGVIGAKGRQQLLQIDTASGKTLVLAESERICNPTPSPSGTQLVYGAGATCESVHRVNSDGSKDTVLVDRLPNTGSTVVGRFSWSVDGRTVSHADCRALEVSGICGGAYWDLSAAGGTPPVPRAAVSSVLREQRALVKPLKVKIEMTGAIQYNDRLLVKTSGQGSSVGSLLTGRRSTSIEATAVDERTTARRFEIKATAAPESRMIAGTIRIVDPNGFDQTVTFWGGALVQSYRYAVVRAVWFDTTKMPLRSGRFDLVIYR